MLLFSEGVWHSTGKELAGLHAVVSDHTDHFVEFWAHLDAASKTTVRRVGCVVAEESCLLEREGLVALLIPGVGDHNAALGASDSSRKEVNRDLVGLQLLVTATALREDPGDAVALNQIEKGLT